MRREQTITLLGAEVPYRLRPSPRAKVMTLRVGPAGVEVLVPRQTSARRAAEFLRENAAWVAEQRERGERLRAARAADLDLPPGHLLLRGEPVPVSIVPHNRRANRVEIDGGGIIVRVGTAGTTETASLEAALRREAHRDLLTCVEQHAPCVSRPVGRVYVRGQRTRWGSCSSRGNLSLNWRLVMAPPAVLRYVVLHELAHLDVPDHSRAFWLRVRSLCPGYEQHRDWLRRNSPLMLRPITDMSK